MTFQLNPSFPQLNPPKRGLNRMPLTPHRVRGIFVAPNATRMKIGLNLVLPALAFVGASSGSTDRSEAIALCTDPPVVPTVTVERSPERVVRGEKLAQLLCLPCHADGANRLTGRRMTDLPRLFGKIYSTNLTQDTTAGIGGWSDGELLYFLRTGLRRNGSLAPAMPRFPLLAEEDLQSVVAYLRSAAYPVRATAEEAPKSRYSLPVKLLAKTVFKPLPYPRTPLPAPDTSTEVALGRYLADGVIGCYACHSAGFRGLDPLHPERSKGYYGGGTRLIGDGGKAIFSSNLTFDSSGIGTRYSREQFVRAVKLGVRADGTPLRAPMPPHLALTDREAGVIYEFLKTIPHRRNAPKRQRAP